MGYLNYPHNIRNAMISSAAQLNENFEAITDLVNKGAGDHGNLDGDNVAPDAQLTGAVVTATTKIIAPVVDADGCIVIKLASNDGSDSVKFKDGNGAVRLEVRSDGEVFVT